MDNNRYYLDDLFLSCMCKRYLVLPGTKILMLVGKELFSRIRRRIDDDDIPRICRFLADHPKVVAANLAYNRITDNGMPHLISFLETNRSLLELNLMCNNIGEDGVIRLAELKNSTILKSLRLNGNKIGCKVNKTLTELHLQKIGFDGHDMEILVEGLKKNSTLLSLDLSCNNIGDLGMEFIADFLGGKPPLATLRLSSNNIGDTGARTLSFKFPYSKIIYLDISKNRITETGVLDILNCLKKEHLVKGLLMRGNQIGEKAAKVIFRMLRSGVLNDKTLDIHVFCSKEKYQFSTTEAVDHIMPHYYCLCAGAECSYCRPSTVMEIRNK
ncbi:NLR family CARD domain-containing protein 3-like isoform X1 [Homalodisca vitripennis]|uniref:NLR family CARD domain-containing protein 3-like isoform X1 n=1 Tax=Homalodisca vitripennis TaxID=197043 RepID=UPI001EECEE5A|nr:NLR family CARD domain-containing protein 3-like isoform X1 [Homalodisca vitripennis]